MRALTRQPAERWLHFTQTNTDSLAISTALCTCIVLLLMAGSDQLFHWLVFPVWLCGILIGIDAVDWFRGRLPLFDPVGVIAVLGIHFFFLAPLLHVAWNYWMSAPSPPADWREAIGNMAVVNLIGLIVYRYFRNFFLTRPQEAQPTIWRLNQPRFVFLATITLIVTALLQAIVYIQFGGIIGYMQAATDLENTSRMQGMGWLFLISESFPMVALILFAVKAREKDSWKSWFILGLVMFSFLLVRLLFGGLRGSRTTILYSLFWAGGILHLYLRLIPRQAVLAGIAFMVMFMYAYGFYKGAGPAAIESIGSAQGRAQLEQTTQRDFATVVLGDLSRSDVQAYILDRLWFSNSTYLSNYHYAWGRTYLGAVAILIPRSLWPNRPEHKVVEGTEIIYGVGTYIEGEIYSSKLYGLAGETMLNFGPLPIPIAFALFGLLVSAVRRQLLSLAEGDIRLLMAPFFTLLCINVLTADSDNVLFFSIQFASIPGFLLLVSAVRFRWLPVKSQPEHVEVVPA